MRHYYPISYWMIEVEARETKGCVIEALDIKRTDHDFFLHLIATIWAFSSFRRLFNLFEFCNTVQYDFFICLLNLSSENKLIQKGIHFIKVENYIQLCDKGMST